AAGDYIVTVTVAGTKTVAIETGILGLEVNKVYTAIAIDSDNGPTLLTADNLAPAFTASKTYTVQLSGSQEVPMVMTDSSATATIEIDESLPAFKVTLDASMVEGATAAHVHAGSIGMNGAVAFGLTSNNDGLFTLETSQLTAGSLNALLSGQWYLNVHTPANPGGEVRGQIVPDTTAVVTFGLSGLQEIPQVTSEAIGYGYALFNTLNNGVTLNVVTSGVNDATMAHIHTGFAGVNGPVLAALSLDATALAADAYVWSTGGEIELDNTTAELLLSGGHYVNVHTPTNPSGELRGQITPANIEV
ncbi:MAG: CHRD domain-containing protein, partial [Paraglaciecola sp.]|nr:CHRD domain-containing protein [Paraglaciecola sp.]